MYATPQHAPQDSPQSSATTSQMILSPCAPSKMLLYSGGKALPFCLIACAATASFGGAPSNELKNEGYGASELHDMAASATFYLFDQ